MKFLPVKTILAKLHRDLGTEDFDESMLLEWAMEGLESIDAWIPQGLSYGVFKVNNNRVLFPFSTDNIIQIVYVESDNTEEVCDLCLNYNIQIEEETNEDSSGCEGNVIKPCDKTVKNYVSFTKNLFVSMLHNMHKHYNLVPLKLSTHTFNNYDKSFNHKPKNSYSIIDDETIHVDRSSNISVLVSYKEIPKDSDGYFMIIDEPYYIRAISKYVTMKIMEKYWYNGREGYGDKVQKAEYDWERFRDIAKSKLGSFRTVGELENYRVNLSLIGTNNFDRFFE